MLLQGILQIIQVTNVLADLFVIIAGTIAIRQYLMTARQERYQYDKERVKLAIEVAEYYKENILKYSRRLKVIMSDIGLLDIAENTDMSKIQYFDIYENEELYSKEQVKQIKNIRKKYGIDDLVGNLRISYRGEEGKKDYKSSSDIKIEKLGKEYVDNMLLILNNLEVFSMYFVHQTADESVVYQPLHMSYLEIVRMLYYDISYANKNGEKKFYVNTIKLFNEWETKSSIQRAKEIDNARNIVEHGKILEKRHNKDIM